MVGENGLKRILSDFFSPKNQDVESFLKKRSIEFTKKRQAVTYLVFSTVTLDLVGYFSITMKPVIIKAGKLSNTSKRKLERVSKYDVETETYTVASYLIAQFGKNYNLDNTDKITGTELMEYASAKLNDIRYDLGGMIAYLECEEVEALLKFYQDNCFTSKSLYWSFVTSCRPLSADNNLKSMEFSWEKCYNRDGVVQKAPAHCVEKPKHIHAGMFLCIPAAADGVQLRTARQERNFPKGHGPSGKYGYGYEEKKSQTEGTAENLHADLPLSGVASGAGGFWNLPAGREGGVSAVMLPASVLRDDFLPDALQQADHHQ